MPASKTSTSKVIVMSKMSCLVLAGLLIGANALAADGAPSSAPAAAPAASPGADLDAQLVAARQKLEAAARDVARLSAQLGQSAMARVQSLRTRAVLGLQLRTEPSSKEQGATVMGVSPAGPAAEAGLASGDIIVALNGEPTVGPDAPAEVVEHMTRVKPDTKVIVKVIRAGKPKEFEVTPRASVADFLPDFNGPVLRWAGPGPGPGPGPNGSRQQELELREIGGVGAIFEGMELADLSPALGQYFGTSQGVLVIKVPRYGEFLKLKDGDVILSIDGRVPENGPHAARILRSYQRGETIHLKVMREKKTLTLDASLPEHRGNVRPAPPDQGGPAPQGRLEPLSG
jgi:S1-C subfamily serine protease